MDAGVFNVHQNYDRFCQRRAFWSTSRQTDLGGKQGEVFNKNDQSTAATVEKQSLNSAGPETWNDETTPFTIVRHYRRGHVTDEQIQVFLQENSITSLQDLCDCIHMVGELIRDRTGGHKW
jgi:hypothetical protein